MQVIQVFGVKNSTETRSAERFFKERGVQIQFIDLNQKAMAPGELRRFVEKFGLQGLLDTEGKAYDQAGLKYLRCGEDELLAKIESEPKLLRLPLVRSSKSVSIGKDEAAWKSMAELAKSVRPQR